MIPSVALAHGGGCRPIAKLRPLPHHLRVADACGVASNGASRGQKKNVLEEAMNRSRRRLLAGSLAFVPLALAGMRAQAPSTTLKISHQFPGGTIDSGDFRDRLVRKFAQEVEKRTNG